MIYNLSSSGEGEEGSAPGFNGVRDNLGGLDDANLTNGCITMPKDPQIWSTICEGILAVIVGICGLMGYYK